MAGLLRVLLVEDSESDAELVAHELRRSGYDIALEVVDTASDLTAALKRRWDLIICDHRLPDLQSLDALRLVGDSGADAPFIVLSGAIGEEAAVEALKAGARDVVLKANLSRLGPVVERELNEAESRRRHREAEEALRESEGRFRSMATNVPGVIYRCALDADWTMEFISDEIEKMTGHPASDFIGNSTRTYASVIHPDDRAMVERVVCESVAAGQRYAIEYRVTCVDGSTRWVYERGRAITGDPGEVLWLDGAIFDMSERKRAEETLRETNETLGALVECSPVAIVAADLEGSVTMWNAAAERMFAWSAAEVLGRPLPFLLPEEVDRLRALRQRVLAGELLTELEEKCIRKDGTAIDVSVSLAPLRDASGNASGTMAILVDICERNRARNELQQSFELLRRSDEERRRLLARLVRAQEEERQRIASDIHDDSVQVLAALTLRLDLLRRRIDDPALLEMLAEAEQTSRLTLARLRRMMFELRPPALDREGLAAALRLYLEQSRTDFGLHYSLINELTAEPEGETRAILYRIAQEALVNVVKHARARCVDILLRETESGFLVRITDDGIGFSREEAGGDRPGHLGLVSMCERAEMAGGWWRLDSVPGRGTTVEFLVPDPGGRTSGEVRSFARAS